MTNKSLEAINTIADFQISDDEYIVDLFCEQINIIRQDLKRKKQLEYVIEGLIDVLDLEVDLDHCNLITNLGTIAFLNVDDDLFKELELLKEVLG